MTTRILLIRHGATVLSAEDRFAGSTDVELSDEGRHQAKCLGARLASEQLAAVYASPMRRTRETAALICTPHAALAASEVPALREIDHGHWEGLSRREVEQRFRSEYDAWELDPFTVAPRAGEPAISVMARAVPAVHDIVQSWPNATVAIVSHKATIRLILASFLGIDPRGYRDRLDQSPACLNVLDFKDTVRARLMLYNDTSHYAERPRTASAQLSKWWDAEA
jgi:broad specificity phosphatase PhoE